MRRGGDAAETAVDWSQVEPGTNSVVINNGDGTETRHYRPIRDAADLESRLRADGVQLPEGVELLEVSKGHWVQGCRLDAAGLKALLKRVTAIREQRQLWADRAEADARLVRCGAKTCVRRVRAGEVCDGRVYTEDTDVEQILVPGVVLNERAMTMNFWRDERGNLLSAELEFISQASAFHGATDQEMAETLWPLECRNEGARLEAALAKVRQHRRTLHKRRIIVRYECKGCPVCRS